MRAWFSLLLLAAAPWVAWAQGLEVSGRVVDAATGAPLPRAVVSLAPLSADGGAPAPAGAAIDQTTGADGGFRFSGLAPGRYSLSGSRRGYMTAAFQEHDGFFAAMIVGAGVAGTNGVRLRLEPYGAITGTVRDSSGDPVDTASLTLFAPASDGSGKVQARQTRYLANGSPRFEFGSLAPGTYFLAVTARPWYAEPVSAGGASPLDVAYPVTFYDGADSSASAQPIPLRAGESAEIGLTLHAVPAVHVEVPTGGSGGFQFPALSAEAFGDLLPVNVGMWGSRGVAGVDGRPPMVASVAPGSYAIRRGETTTTQDIQGDTQLGSEAAAPAPVTIAGKLAMADGSALPHGLLLRLQPNGPQTVRLAGRFRHGRSGFGGLEQRPTELAVSPDGSFHAAELPPGEYRLELEAPGNGAWVVTGAAASGGTLGDDLRLHVGADPVMLAATVEPANGTVSGEVAGGESGVMVLLLPQEGSPATLGREDESDSDGTWTERGVAPGAYRVVAIRDGWDLPWKAPGALARYLHQGAAVTVAAGARAVLPEKIAVQAR